MERRYSLGAGRGWLGVREEGGKAVCQVELADDGRGLYKAYLAGHGSRLLLGTLTPEGGRLALRRTLDVEDLRRRRLWPPEGGVVELAFAFRKGDGGKTPPSGWQREDRPGRLMGDELLIQAASQVQGALLRRKPDGFQLALPYDPSQAFGLSPLFCFAHLARLEGKPYWVFSFDQGGMPVFPHNTRSGGETNDVNHTKE